jgi:hypothetical protein
LTIKQIEASPLAELGHKARRKNCSGLAAEIVAAKWMGLRYLRWF